MVSVKPHTSQGLYVPATDFDSSDQNENVFNVKSALLPPYTKNSLAFVTLFDRPQLEYSWGCKLATRSSKTYVFHG